MNYKEVYAHNAFECKVWFGFNKPTIKKYLFRHLVLDCGITSNGNSIISSFSQAEEYITKWYNSGGWMKICGNDKDREEWSIFINDTSAFGEIEITKMEKTWFYFLQKPQNYIDRPDVYRLIGESVLEYDEEDDDYHSIPSIFELCNTNANGIYYTFDFVRKPIGEYAKSKNIEVLAYNCCSNYTESDHTHHWNLARKMGLIKQNNKL